MAVVALIAFIITGWLLFILVKSSQQRRRNAETMRNGFKMMIYIQQLIELMQQHRGVSNAFNNGNQNLKSKLTSLDNQIDGIINGAYSAEFNKFEQWQSFTEHWPRLKANCLAGGLEAKNLMRQHHLVIEGQLSLLDDLIHYYELHKVMLDRFMRAADLCTDILRTTETIAQARGLGSGICAVGQSRGADSIQLNFLKVSFQNTTYQLFSELDNIDNPDLQAKFNAFSQSIKSNVEKFVEVLDKEVLEKKQLTLDTQTYFDIATKPIDDLVSLYCYMVDYSSEKLERSY
jgi:hypothetical protein